MLTLFHMASKLVLPLPKAGYQRGVRALLEDQHGVVDRVAVEAGHDGEVLPVFIAFKQLPDALLDLRGNLSQPLLCGVFLYSWDVASAPCRSFIL